MMFFNKFVRLGFSLFSGFALLCLSLHLTQSQYNPKRILVYVGSAEYQSGVESLALFDPQSESIITLVSPLMADVIYSPRWSPSGQYIAFYKTDDEKYVTDLFLYDVELGKEIQLTDDESQEGCLSWSFNSEEIVYSSLFAGSSRSIYRQNILTGERVEIGTDIDIQCLSLSPDGQRYVFSLGVSKDNEVKADIFITDSKFDEITQLTNTDLMNEYLPVWSPNGRYIVFGEDDVSDADHVISKLIVFDLTSQDKREIAVSSSGSFIAFNWLSDNRLAYKNPEDYRADQPIRIHTFDIVTNTQVFVDLPTYTHMRAFDWSPPTDEILPNPTPTAPTPNLNFPAAPTCLNALPSRLGTFMIAGVPHSSEGEVRSNLRVRNLPSGTQIASLLPGQQFRIADQGKCGNDGLLWWPIETLDGSITGWSAESVDNRYLMEPIAAP